ncbi:molybdopterin-guanine dinucleotide biosynthesis protein B [Oceanicella sp. SM1341]|uniref:molybdopterin-guanine dinucleotide biosynthesis protein B n=1 Tax=Oceanicella sp. SM1341 TaxID=1548889 RepID=UPI000E4B05F2|nr:molybdopterin-guanine dinucleotide biosynthesis protein B [Oceanicella sp. SM1341]
MRVFGIVGWKNSGKTTLMERLVAEITARGFTVSTVKHAHHEFDVDRPGKDSHRHRMAGAQEVLLSSARRWALMHEMRGAPETPLPELLKKLSPVDLILVEGYKRDSHPKVEAWRRETGNAALVFDDPTVRAVATNDTLEGVTVPLLPLDDAATVADFILREVGLVPAAAQ